MFTIDTGSGFWTPLIWVIAVGVAFLLMYILRNLGKKTYKQDTEQVKAFLSGNAEYDKEHMQVKSSNLYWGFTSSLNWVYITLKKIHNGNAGDYVLWFVVVLAVVLLLGVML